MANQTNIPLHYSIEQVSPLYWGTIQPGERITKQTGRVWFTVRFCAAATNYDKVDPPSTDSICAAAAYPYSQSEKLAEVIDVGDLKDWVKVEARDRARLERWEDGARSVRHAGADTIVKGDFYDACARAFGEVKRTGHYANGDWLHVRGGIENNQPYAQWSSMRIEG